MSDVSREADPRHLSVSSASIYDQCPRRWQFKYVERRPDPKGIPALVGILAHRILEDLLALEPIDRTIDNARIIAARLWPDAVADPDFVALDLDEQKTRAFKWDTWRAVEGLWHLEDPAEVDVHSTEQRLSVELAGIPFLGIVDRVDHHGDGLVVSDYKSGKLPRPRYLPDKLGQVMLYAAALEAAGEPRPVRTRLLYLGSQMVETPVTGGAIDKALNGLRSTWDALVTANRTAHFEPSPGPLCGWCPYAAACPEGLTEVRNRSARGQIRSSAPALTLVA